MKLGIAGLTREIRKVDAEQLRRVRSLGFSAISSLLMVDDPPSEQEIRTIRALLEDNGVTLEQPRIRPGVLVAAEDGRADASLPHIRLGLELASRLGSRMAVIPGGGFNPKGFFLPHA